MHNYLRSWNAIIKTYKANRGFVDLPKGLDKLD